MHQGWFFKRRLGLLSFLLSLIIFFFQWWMQEKKIITEQNADILLYVSITICVFAIGYILWPIIRRLRITLQSQSPIPVQGLSSEERELLDFYNRQKDNWKSDIRMQIVHVIPKVTGNAPPKVVFELEVRNYLPVGFKLLKVTHSSGRVNAGELGYRELPALPETIDENVGSCTEKRFSIDVAIHGTDIPKFLESVSKPGQLLQWTLKGQWYVEIYGKIVIWQYQSYEMLYDQIVRAS